MINLPHVDINPCLNSSASCDQMRTKGELYPIMYEAFLMVVDGSATSGIAGVHCSIDYDADLESGIYIGDAWAVCADAFVATDGSNGAWPSPGSSILIEWNSDTHCQRFEPGGTGTGVIASAGYFVMSAGGASSLRVIPSPVDGVAAVMTCSGVVDTVEGGGIVRERSHVGFARFSPGAGESGYSPCGLAAPVVPTTWGRVKAILSTM